MANETRTRPLYQAPWTGGLYDLSLIIGLSCERERLTVQFRGGGYARGPQHPDAAKVCADMERRIAELPGVVVYRFLD